MPEQLEQRAKFLRRVILIGLVLLILSLIADIGDYYRRQDWQILLDGAIIIVTITLLFVARNAVRREKFDTAGYWILAALLIGMGLSEIIWLSEPVFVISVALLILLVGTLVLRRKWIAWLTALGLYLGWVALINIFNPLPRINAANSSEQLFIYIAVIALAAGVIIWQYTVTRRRLRTIRGQLLVTFVPMVLLLAAVIGGSAFWVARNQVRRQVENQLESVATLKEAEIQGWLNDLQMNLNLVASGEQLSQHLKNILYQKEAEPSSYEKAYSSLQGRLTWAVEQMGLFDEMFILNPQGRVILSTDPTQEGKVYIRESYFQPAMEGPYVQPPSYSPSLEETSVLNARPLKDENGDTIAILVGRTSINALNEIMLERAGLGETGETYLVGNNNALLTDSRFEAQERIYAYTEGANTAINYHTNGSGQYQNYRDIPVVGVYRWLPELQVALMAEQGTDEAYRGITRILLVDAGIGIGAVLVVIIASLILTHNIVEPLTNLAETAQKIAAGDRERIAQVEHKGEVGTLARSFNSMTQQLRDLIGGLEQRVADRTHELEQRSSYLEASAEISQAASSILDREQLMREVVELIRERIDLYYVGLFLIEGDWAVLQAGTGEAGQAMLDRGHQLEVGGGSMIGWSTAHGQARIAQVAQEDAVRLATPELPETRAEAALPLRSRGQIIGALTVQSDHPGAFDEATLAVLQTMADQVAVALDNARLFAETQEALEAERRAYGELSRRAWNELLRTRTDWGYDYGHHSIVPARSEWSPEMREAERTGEIIQGTASSDGNGREELTLAMPLRVRDQVVGVMSFHKDGTEGSWSDEEVRMLEALIEELGQALESARLYEDTQRRAARERMLSEVTASFAQSLDFEAVLQAAAQELGRLPKVTEASVHVGVSKAEPETAESERQGANKEV